jgi:hypothetical protein
MAMAAPSPASYTIAQSTLFLLPEVLEWSTTVTFDFAGFHATMPACAGPLYQSGC